MVETDGRSEALFSALENEQKEDLELWEREMVENVRGELVPLGNYDYVGKFKDWVRENLFPSVATGIIESIMKKAWTGSIGVDATDTERSRRISEVVQPNNLARYYVEADPNAPTRCIDGRCKTCYGDDGHDVNEPLGAQVPGGSPTAALCYRVVAHDTFETDDYSINDDIVVFNDRVKKLGLSVGAHTGDSADGDMTGCGALDKLPEILERVTSPAASKQTRKLAKRILGKDFYDTEMVDGIIGRLTGLRSEEERYLGKYYTGEFKEDSEPVSAYEYRQKALERVD